MYYTLIVINQSVALTPRPLQKHPQSSHLPRGLSLLLGPLMLLSIRLLNKFLIFPPFTVAKPFQGAHFHPFLHTTPHHILLHFHALSCHISCPYFSAPLRESNPGSHSCEPSVLPLHVPMTH